MAKPWQTPLDTKSEDLIAISEALFNSIGEAVVATDDEGRIMRVNDAALELFECDESDLLGKKYLSAVRSLTLKGEEYNPLNRPIMRALIEGKSVSETVIYFKSNGKQFPVHLTVSPIMLNGTPIGTIQVIRDVTREQRIDRAKTEFVSLASHQLRTPLTAMRWYIELMLRGNMGKLTKEQQESLQEVYNVNLRLIELVGALLSVARIEIGTLTIAPVPSDITQLAKDVTADLKPQIIEKELNFKEQYDANIPTMQLDPDLTRVIFQNLLTNAVKYTPPGGTIELSVKLEKKNVLIRISDNGYGIPKRQQKLLFTKLFRADNARRQDTDGTGLGLYIVQSIVESAKGKIWFESEEDEGTTFYVRLPLNGMPAVSQSINNGFM